MKKLLLASTAIGGIGLAGPALAADLPVKAAPLPMVAPAFSWTGCYIGANVGGARGQKEWDDFGGSLLTQLFGGALVNELVSASGSHSLTGTITATATGIEGTITKTSTISRTFTFTASSSTFTGTISASSSFSVTRSASASTTSGSATFSHTTRTQQFTSISDDTAGWLAGGQVGCDYQFAPKWVIGFEGDGEWASITGRTDFTQTTIPFLEAGVANPSGAGSNITVLFPAAITGTGTARSKTEWLAAITARIGYVPWDRWLFYVKGGAAWAGDKYGISGTGCSTVSFVKGFASSCGDFDLTGKETRFGWTTGLGIEYAFWNGMSAKLEYDHYDFGTKTVTFTDNLGLVDTGTARIRQTIEVLKFGVNYRFYWGKAAVAPVVARY